MENKTQMRDYDNEPIVIKDRISEITFCFFMAFALIPLGLITLWMHLSGKEIDWTHLFISLSILYLPTYFFLKSRIAKIRTISLSNHKIIRKWDDEILEIKWSDVEDIKKSFMDFNDKKQKIDKTRLKLFSWLFTPFAILIAHPYLIVIKFLYKTFKSLSNKSLFDTIVIFDKNDEMIAIFVSTLEEKDELRKYFSQKGFDIDNLSIFYSTSYGTDDFTHYVNKKDK